MKNYDVTVIGGGPAGLAAAVTASACGSHVLLIEREERLGGILKQCIHDGFGVIRFGEKLSGCEYACRFIHELEKTDVEVMTQTFASRIENDTESGVFRLYLTTRSGFTSITTKSLVLATGCRERTARQVAIHGTRPAGVLTAGSAQYYINVLGQLPGKNCVILGSGDIGLIMARRLTLEGAKVKGVYEAKPEPSGLSRNIYQCLVDFDIPLSLSHTVTCVHGRERIEAVTVSEVDEKMNPIPGTEETVPCDCLILSVGLIPENEIAESLGVKLSPATKGAVCDQNYMTSVPGVFACGNALHVNDLVDYVSESGETAGRSAALYASDKENFKSPIYDLFLVPVQTDGHFQYAVPQKLSVNGSMTGETAEFFFRSRTTRGPVKVTLYIDDLMIFSKTYEGLRPPEMEKITVPLEDISFKQSSVIKFEMEDIRNE